MNRRGSVMGFKRVYKNWFTHNTVGHTLMAIFQLFGLNKLGVKIHNATLPEETEVEFDE